MNIVSLRKGKTGVTLLLYTIDDRGLPISPRLQTLLHLVGILRLAKDVHVETLVAQLLLALVLAGLRLETRWVLIAVLLVPVVRWGFAAGYARACERRAFDVAAEDRREIPAAEGEDDHG